MKLSVIIVLLVSLGLTSQCKYKIESAGTITVVNKNLSIDSAIAKVQDTISIINTWVCSFPFYYSGLTFKLNGTFSYFDAGCLGKCKSRGMWTKTGNIYTLTSFKQYNKDRTKYIYSTLRNEQDSLKPKYLSGDSISLTDSTHFKMLDLTPLTPISVSIIRPETTNVYFNKERYLLLNDTLYRLTKSGHKSDTKYVLSKNSR